MCTWGTLNQVLTGAAETRFLGKLCEPCHNAVDWKRWSFDHDTRTRFKLDGAHKKLTCYDCHSKPVDDAKLPMACVACHNADDVHGGAIAHRFFQAGKPARSKFCRMRGPGSSRFGANGVPVMRSTASM